MTNDDLVDALRILKDRLDALDYTDAELTLAGDIAEWYNHRLVVGYYAEVGRLRAELAARRR